MSPTQWVDDSTISNDALLWRRIAPRDIRIDPQTGHETVSSAAFRTQQMSVHIASLTNIQNVLANYPNDRLAQFRAREVRAVGCIVIGNPLQDDPSHALVCRNDDHTQRLTKFQARQIANSAQLVN